MDTTDKKTDSTIIGNCLICNGLVRIPSSADANSKVRCPHCSEMFALKNILENSIPELELIVEEEAEIIPRADQVVVPKPESEKSREKFVVPSQLSKGAIRKSRRRRRKDSERKPESTQRRSTDAQVNVTPQPRTSSSSSHSRRSSDSRSEGSRSRKRRDDPSSIVEMIKIVMGALLAFPIAYLLILWVVQSDPLNVTPSMLKVAPWAVPGNFHPAEVVEETDSESTENSGAATDLEPSNDESDKLPVPDVSPEDVR